MKKSPHEIVQRTRGRDNGDAGNDILDGGAGFDYLQGGMGDDVYEFGQGGGKDWIFEVGGSDTLRFGERISEGDITFARDGYDLVLGVGGGNDRVTLLNFGGGADYRTERVEFAGGAVWDAENDAVFEVRGAA